MTWPMSTEQSRKMSSQTSVAVLTNFIPPYRISFFEALQANLQHLKLFISVSMEKNRQWPVEWGNLDVKIQKTVTIPIFWRHPSGFKEELSLHFPIDTIPQLIQFHPDVIVSVEMGFRTLQAVIYRLFSPRTRLIFWEAISEHTEKGRGFFRLQLRRFLIRFADAVWVNGASGERYILKLGVDQHKIVHVPYTIDSQPFVNQKPSVANQVLRLLLVGQLVERKGILPFLSALRPWAELHPEQNLEIWLLGEGPLRQVIEDFKLPGNVRLKLLGHVSYQDLPGIYAQASLLVFPTLADEWGIVVNEAMAAGLPVLGSIYSQAVEEMVQQDVTGWIFHTDNPAEMASMLEKAVSTPPCVLGEMGQKARQRVAEFGIDQAVVQMMKSIACVNER
jgi:glycosyltransferase involved in cell wall biosynthesis